MKSLGFFRSQNSCFCGCNFVVDLSCTEVWKWFPVWAKQGIASFNFLVGHTFTLPQLCPEVKP